MKKVIFCLLLFITSNQILKSQSTEFTIHDNGLMYHDSTMKQLAYIVDTLNLAFKACDINKKYHSKHQTTAHLIKLNKGNIKEAKKDMENQISFSDFINKYPKATVHKNVLVVTFQYQNYQKEYVNEYFSYLKEQQIQITHQEEYLPLAKPKSWVINYWAGGEYTEESVDAFYFDKALSTQPLPNYYAKKIQYVDCLVDTTTDIHTEKANSSSNWYDEESNKDLEDFLSYIHTKTNLPTYEGDYDSLYSDKMKLWQWNKYQQIDSLLSHDKKCKKLFEKAVDSALETGDSNDELEEYVARYKNTHTALALKRNRKVVGYCSMDSSPRYHALGIALLSTETINWETFLRAHLNILNDNFERMSDGSYAWGGRQTYLKELEQLSINIPDLLVGIALRISNPAQNHYYGSIRRIGRAMVESSQKELLEQELVLAIKDNSLDDYNRLLMYYLYANYCHFHENEKDQKLKELDKVVTYLPSYMQVHLKRN